MIPVDQQFGYSPDVITLLNKAASISVRVLSRALNTPGGIPSSPGALFTFSLFSTSSTSVTDISLSRSGMFTLAVFGGSFCSLLLFMFRFWKCDIISLGFTSVSVCLSFFLRSLTVFQKSLGLLFWEVRRFLWKFISATRFLALIIFFIDFLFFEELLS